MKKIIVFEEIHNLLRPLIRWYLLKGYAVYYLRLHFSCKNRKWLIGYINNSLVTQIDRKHDILSNFTGIYSDPIYENMEKIARLMLYNKKLPLTMVKLYKNESIYNFFKKFIGEQFQRFYYINFMFKNLNDFFGGSNLIFIPVLLGEKQQTTFISADDYQNLLNSARESGACFYDIKNIKFPFWLKVIGRLNNLIKFLFFGCKTMGVLIFALGNNIRRFSFQPTKKRREYKFGINIISENYQFSNPAQIVDFLVDKDKIKKEDVLFISTHKLLPKNKEYLISCGYAFTDDLILKIDSSPSNEVIFPLLNLLKSAIFYKKCVYVLNAVLNLILYYMVWKSFSKRFYLRSLITFCDFSTQSIARNILLSENGTKSWFYLHSSNWFTYFISTDRKIMIPRYAVNFFGYLDYDYFISWSKEISDFCRVHNQNIKNYVDVGCLWAQRIEDIQNGKINTSVKNKIFSARAKDAKKIVSVFDSSYIDNSINGYEDGVLFLRDILRLLNEMPDIFVLLKEKKSRQYIKKYSPEMIDILEKIEKHPRSYLPGRNTSPSEVIAFSDLVISFPFTSPTFEALSARKKAIYYDVSNKFETTFFDKIPGMVCHNYSELIKRVDELLYKTNELEYDQYLDKFVKGRVEPYLDSNAITRFRNLLANAQN